MLDGYGRDDRQRDLFGDFDKGMRAYDEYGGADEPAELGNPFSGIGTFGSGIPKMPADPVFLDDSGLDAEPEPAFDDGFADEEPEPEFEPVDEEPGFEFDPEFEAAAAAVGLSPAEIALEGDALVEEFAPAEGSLPATLRLPDEDDHEDDEEDEVDDDLDLSLEGTLFPATDDEPENDDGFEDGFELEPEPEEEPFSMDDLDPRDRRGAWVEIDTKAIMHNIDEFKKRVGPRVRIMAVVKADAYGHGAVECSKLALRAGATWLAVATVDEAVELREAGIDAPILVLSQPPAATIPALVRYKISPAVYSVEFAMELAEYAAERGEVADYHLCVNTGMNRIGVWYSDVADFMSLISFHIGLNLQGTFTHFATADAHEDYVFKLQLKRFKEALAQLKSININPGIVHCANSAAAIRYKESYFDMVRVGISMYGLHPSTVTRRMIELWPAMSVHARITAVNDVPVGEGVGYSMSYRSPGNVKVCTLPIGYADGMSRTLSNRMSVIYKSKFFPQVGNICMDQMMFEVDKRSTLLNPAVEPMVGDEVMVVGRAGDYILHLDDMADALGTINYELSCRFGMRLPRVYV